MGHWTTASHYQPLALGCFLDRAARTCCCRPHGCAQRRASSGCSTRPPRRSCRPRSWPRRGEKGWQVSDRASTRGLRSPSVGGRRSGRGRGRGGGGCAGNRKRPFSVRESLLGVSQCVLQPPHGWPVKLGSGEEQRGATLADVRGWCDVRSAPAVHGLAPTVRLCRACRSAAAGAAGSQVGRAAAVRRAVSERPCGRLPSARRRANEKQVGRATERVRADRSWPSRPSHDPSAPVPCHRHRPTSVSTRTPVSPGLNMVRPTVLIRTDGAPQPRLSRWTQAPWSTSCKPAVAAGATGQRLAWLRMGASAAGSQGMVWGGQWGGGGGGGQANVYAKYLWRARGSGQESPLWNHSYWTRVEGKARRKSRMRWVLARGAGPTQTTHAWCKSRCLGCIALTTASASVGRGGPTTPLSRALRHCSAWAATVAGSCSGQCGSTRPPCRFACPPGCSST